MEHSQTSEVSRIPIRVGPPTDLGALRPLTSGGSGGLNLRGQVTAGTASSVGVNVDSLVILDGAADGTVFFVEVLLPMRGWRSVKAAPLPPRSPRPGSIAIAHPGPSIYLEREPHLTIDPERTLHIELEESQDQATWVALSDSCYALLSEGFLAGLVVRLQQR